MTRKLIAFLALLSGLAAIGGTATVSYAQTTSSCDASVSAAADSIADAKRSAVKKGPGKADTRTKGSDRKKRAPTPPSLRMPVLMGIDRAYE